MNKLTIGEKIGRCLIYFILTVVAVVCVFPFLYILGVSLTSETEVVRRGIVIIPENITFYAYHEIMSGGVIVNAYKITIFRTIVGTILSLVFTMTTAYPLAKKFLPGRNKFLLYIVFTMLFSGGLIPTYMVVKFLGLLDTVWAMVVPGLISVFLLVIMKSFFEEMPDGIEESARMDGAGELTVLFRIFLPLSMPVIATVGLFYAVGNWNSYFDALLYIHKTSLQPLQVILRGILITAAQMSTDTPESNEAINPLAIRMAAVVVTTVPILCVYPFIQKHFTKGVMLGSIKG